MPNGHTHDAVTWFLVTPVALSAWCVGQDPLGTAVAAASFTFAGLMFSGDLDLPSSQYRRWGRMRWIWKPYQWVVPHRSAISHGIVLGPISRLGYLALLALLLATVAWRCQTGVWAMPWPSLQLAAGVVQRMDAHAWGLVAYAAAGLWLGGASHSLADWGWSAWKRRLR